MNQIFVSSETSSFQVKAIRYCYVKKIQIIMHSSMLQIRTNFEKIISGFHDGITIPVDEENP